MCSLPGDDKKQKNIGDKAAKGVLGELVQEGLSIIRKRINEAAAEVWTAHGVKSEYDETESNGDSNEYPFKRIRKDVAVENKEETTSMCSSLAMVSNRRESLRIFSQDILPMGIDTEVTGSWVSVTMSKLLRSVGEPEVASDAFVIANALLDYAWQKLNTGHWRDVPMTWRLVFTWGSVVVAHLLLSELQTSLNGEGGAQDPLSFAAEVVKACDRGLLMGAPILANPLHKVASLFNFHARLSMRPFSVDLPCEDLPVTQQDEVTVHRPLPTEECPPLDRFLLSYMGKGVPVKLMGIVDHWPALKTWTVPYLREIAGARTVPVEIGARYTDASWSQSLLSLDDYLTRFVSQPTAGAPTGYLAQHQLLDQIPELRDDILVPDYCHLGEEEPRLHAWLGPQGTVSPLHHDPDHNILVQVLGYKYIRLYPEDQSHLLYAHPDPLLRNTSQADVEGSVSEWPLLQEANYSDLILSPGEALYIPPRHWHYAGEWWRRASATFWDQDFWLPAGVTWDDIHTSLSDIIFIPLLIGVLFLVLRDFVVEPLLLLPIARRVQIPNRRRSLPEPNETLERLFQRYETTPPQEELAEASKATHLTERQVERWLRRRYAVNRLNRYEKFLNCGFKLVCHICFGVLGASVTLSKSFFWDTTLCWKDYPNHPVSSDIYWYYMILLGYYWAITFDELPRPGGKGFDKAQMILHHTLTILLIVFSWTTGYVRIGSLILFVHEYSDIALLAAKVCHYAGNDAPTEPLFKAFLVLWGVTRCGILPFWIVRSVFLEAKPAGVDMPALYMMQSWFVVLLCLTAIWTGLIVRTVARKLRGGGLRDARSATEESESEEHKKTQ